ncbi:hypothetical protein PSE10B_51490 [Pseudomonas amygdali pv. eriobotryae]|uniref:GmrSD restriction endonuclease domain-containing protein n=1 Tax=Pseudomonas amygdali TaxID=47877 RepID=UPI0016789F22|nr:DUF262 domain-containing protein [Pseudomonas amygdali]GFZ68627.1 hypothetical protein PSE10B_51490 [Pseudomonas amygdali pv. eriobotryae]
MSAAITPQLVQRVFELYLENKLVVNRRYQRKLVWAIEEKEKFIDSLAKGYPIPMILTSKQEGVGVDIGALEILDGLQRLNAITSFIECDFSLAGKFFDLETTSLTKSLKDQGKLKQRQPMLDSKVCSTILNYQIPFLTTHINTPEFIDETFRRINTGGRRLSMQDVRQAGSLGIIPETINKISNYVRKDSSRTDIVTLRNMKNISIGDDKLNYGINIKDIFWVKSEIIRREDIRESRDEELIAHLLSYVSVPKECHTTSDYLNKVYDSSTKEHQELASTLEKYKEDYIIKSFNFIFDELNKVFKDDRGSFSNTIFTRQKQKSSRCFQVIFLSMYELIINEAMAVNNYKDLHGSLRGIYDKHYSSIMANNRKWHNEERTSLIEATKGIIRKHFVKSKDNKFEPGNWIRNIENIINESKTEQQSYDFKMGLMTLSNPKKELNFELIDKILKTLVAMTNSITGECTVIVGVAESHSDAKEHESKFNRSFIKYSSKFIVGIDSEADYLYGGIDSYLKIIKDYIGKNRLISEGFKLRVLNKLSNFTYKEKEILIFRAERGLSPEAYDNKYFERHLSHNSEIKPGVAMNDLFKRF